MTTESTKQETNIEKLLREISAKLDVIIQQKESCGTDTINGVKISDMIKRII